MNRLIYIMMAMCAVCACSKEGSSLISPPSSEQEATIMHVKSNILSFSSTLAEETPAFIFWLGNEYGATMGTATAVSTLPYFVSYPDGKVDDYAVTPYSTGRLYMGTCWIYANGFAPACLTPDTSSGEQDWTILNVPAEERGYHNIMTAQGSLSGNESDKLHENNKILRFRPIQCRVNFYAKLGTIGNDQYFKGVTISMDGSERFTKSLKWNNQGTSNDITDDRYEAFETSTESTIWTCTDPDRNQMDPNETGSAEHPGYRKIGTVYMHPGIRDIVFDINVITSDSPLFITTRTINQHDNHVQFLDNNTHEPITLGNEEEYDILITINYDSISLIGRKAEWEEGGGLLIPIYPNK